MGIEPSVLNICLLVAAAGLDIWVCDEDRDKSFVLTEREVEFLVSLLDSLIGGDCWLLLRWWLVVIANEPDVPRDVLELEVDGCRASDVSLTAGDGSVGSLNLATIRINSRRLKIGI